MFEKAVIMSREISFSSLLGLKGLISPGVAVHTQLGKNGR